MSERDRVSRVLLSPRVVFPALAAAILLAVLFAPEGNRAGDERLSSHSVGPMGARGLFDLSRRLGWAPLRRTGPFQGRLDSAAVYLVLDPPVEMGARETGALLAAVRRGAGLLYVVSPRDALADSLKLGRSEGGLPQDTVGLRTPGCATAENRTHGINWPNDLVNSYWLEARAPYPSDTLVFLRVRREPLLGAPRPRAGDTSGAADDDVAARSPAVRERLEDVVQEAPAAVGFQLGRGRVVALADPDWLRNDVLRVCRWGASTAAARMLSWLSAPRDAVPDGSRRLVFDEFHQGFGTYRGAGASLRELALGSGWGRAIVQGALAALVLLLALAPRPIAPRMRERVERRSALEHVGALARAYERIGATRLATRRLVRGARRRRGGASASAGSRLRGAEEDWLRDVATRHPAAEQDAQRVLRALEGPVPAAELLAVGRSIDNIERALTR